MHPAQRTHVFTTRRQNELASGTRAGLYRLGALLILVGVIGCLVYSGSRASGNSNFAPAAQASLNGSSPVVAANLPGASDRFHPNYLKPASSSSAPLLVPAVTLQESTCTTSQVNFNLNDSICITVTGAVGQRILVVDPQNLIRQDTTITDDPQVGSFLIPATASSSLFGGFLDENNLGTWRAVVVAGSDLITAEADFVVKDPAQATSNVEIYTNRTGGDLILAGGLVTYDITMVNYGPDAAANASFTNPTPAFTTFSSVNPNTNCNSGNPLICTVTSLAPNSRVTFTVQYQVGNVGTGSSIGVSAAVSTDTANISTKTTANSTGSVTGGTPATCTLGCPGDITVTATSPSGAVVNFAGSIEVSGDCGTISSVPASGTIFPVGTTPVSVSSGTGGGSCIFNVTVIDTPAPTITCPSDKTAAAPPGQSEVTVSIGTPTITGTGVSVGGDRSDGRELTDPYPIGTTTITWTVTDSAQRTASCIQHVVVTSADSPTITCPTDRTFTAAAGECQKTVLSEDIGLPSTTGVGVVVTNERSDDQNLTAPYPAGDTFITWTATNAIGIASCTQKIHINALDTEAPVLTVPADVSVTVNACSALLDDELGVATATDNCTASVNVARTGVPTVSCPPTPANPSGICESFVFPVGTTNVTYTATDAAGNTATGVQHVTVHELTPPSFTFVPANVTVNTGAGATSCGAFVGDATLGTAIVSDNCDTTVIRSGVPAGNIFPVGPTTIIYTAKADLSVTATQIVTVVDNTPPVVTPPAAVTLFTGPGATSCGVTVSNLDATLGTGSATDNCPGVGPVTRSGVPAGNFFPVGPTTVTYSATDAHSNTGSANQLVTVVDNTPPVISCPASFTLEPTCPSGAIGTYTTPVGTDNCSATTTRTAGQASGTVFPIGTTTVTYTVNDGSGNSASCSFTVTVLTPQAVLQNLISQVNASSLTGTQKNGLLAKLNAALTAINGGQTNVACNKLSEFVNNVQNYISHGDLTAAQGNAWILSASHVQNTIGCTNNPCS